jgi:hypothetical protein
MFALVDVNMCYVFSATFARRYMKAGAILVDFFSQGISQLNLFDDHKPKASSEVFIRRP